MTGVTVRTLRVLECIAAGQERTTIAAELRASESTVSREADRACAVLHVPRNRRPALVDAALRQGLITLPERPPAQLDEHLVDTLELIAAGYTNAEIAAELFLSYDAVKSRVKRILQDLHANDRTHAVAIGWQRRLLRRDWATASSA
jgi:DNA-binding NarL/FixJ family response regulator